MQLNSKQCYFYGIIISSVHEILRQNLVAASKRSCSKDYMIIFAHLVFLCYYILYLYSYTSMCSLAVIRTV